MTLAAAAAAVVVIAAAPAAAQDSCGVPAAPSWTQTETTVWRQLCAGEWADLNPAGEILDPSQPDGWDERRVVSSAFVEQLLTEPYATLIDRHGIRLIGAWFPGGLDVHEAAMSFPLRCQNCRIAGLRADDTVIDGTLDLRRSTVEGELILLGADIGGDLVVHGGSVVSGTLNADRLTVAGDVFLGEGSQFTDIDLLGGDIGGQLAVNGGSVVSGTLNANGLTVAGGVLLRDGSQFKDIILLGADIGGTLEVQGGSVVSGTLSADRLTVAGNVFLNGGSQFTDIRLRGADIGGNLDVHNGSVVSGILNADGLTVAGPVFLGDGSQFADIRLVGADIGGNLEVQRGSVVSGTLNAELATVAGGVFLRDGSRFADIRLFGADIGGNLEVSNRSVVSGTLIADGLTVAGGVFLRGGSQFTDIRLLGADISALDVGLGSVVSGTLTAERLTVAGDVFLGDGSEFSDIDLIGADIGGFIILIGAKWGPSGGSIALQQAHAGGISTDDRAESLPAKLRLNGFTFEQWASPDPRELGAGWFTGVWLDRLDSFSPGPYNQLAAVMDAGGHPTIAADIRYSRSRAESLAVPWSRPDRWGRGLYWLVLGYGLRPWRALGWFFAVWLIGCLALRVRLRPAPVRTLKVDAVAARPPPGGMRRWRGRIARVARFRPVKAGEWSAGQAALYSLDRLLPAVNLVDPDEFPAPTRAQGHWLTVQTLLGWLLTLFIFGWLGSLLVQT